MPEAPLPTGIPAIRVIMMPKDTNALGTIFGGVILSYIDQAGAVEAHRSAPGRIVTVAMREVVFHAPVHVGDLVSFFTSTKRLGTSSVTVLKKNMPSVTHSTGYRRSLLPYEGGSATWMECSQGYPVPRIRRSGSIRTPAAFSRSSTFGSTDRVRPFTLFSSQALQEGRVSTAVCASNGPLDTTVMAKRVVVKSLMSQARHQC